MLTALDKFYLSFIVFLFLCFLFIGFYCTLFCQFIIYFSYCFIYHFILKDIKPISFIDRINKPSIVITYREFEMLISFILISFIIGNILFIIYDNFPMFLINFFRF